MKIKFHSGLHQPNTCKHGPQTWEWWRIFGWLLCDLAVQLPSTGKRLWIYTRWWAVYFDIVFDRRLP